MVRFKTIGKWMLAAVLALAIWAGAEFAIDGKHSLRDFDGGAVGRLETKMWRSYYERRPVRLFGELIELMREQYHLPLWRSAAAAYHAARAAVVFQRGNARGDYELALPDLNAFYAGIRRGSDVPFDVAEAARLELEWWIVHREREGRADGDLERSLAALQAALYRLPPAVFEEHARARAAAMLLRDRRSEAITEEDWKAIGGLLDQSWVSLRAAVGRHSLPGQ